MKKHMTYEFNLHLMLKRILKKNNYIFDNILDNVDKPSDYFYELNKNRQEYLTLEEDLINDIFYTVKTTCQLLYLTNKYFTRTVESYI